MSNHRAFWTFAVVAILSNTVAFTQPAKGTAPGRVISLEEIQKAGDQDLQKVLNYLLPDLFPKNEESWYRAAEGVTIYIGNVRFEPEDLRSVDAKSVTRILIWEKPWEQAPAEFPSLLKSRYVLSIETS